MEDEFSNSAIGSVQGGLMWAFPPDPGENPFVPVKIDPDNAENLFFQCSSLCILEHYKSIEFPYAWDKHP